jgi:anti-sigma B factor antagonist
MGEPSDQASAAAADAATNDGVVDHPSDSGDSGDSESGTDRDSDGDGDSDSENAELDDIARFEVEPGAETVVRVVGELDALSGSTLRSLLARAFDERPTAVVVDLGEVSFIDSVGLSILVTAHNRGEAQSIPFTVRSASPACQRVFEITRLVDVLRLT